MYYAAICTIAKDEDLFIFEWLDFHLRIGFEHVYLYDNNSRNPLRTLLADYIAHGLVTVTEFPPTEKQQMAAFAACLNDHGASTEWMAFIDVDEFVVMRQHTDVRDLLDNYMRHGGLALHWKMFGSGGHKTRPPGGLIRNYHGVVRHDPHVKVIARPGKIASMFTPHNFRYLPGYTCVNEDEVPVMTHHSYHTSKIVQLNHYYYKSYEDFLLKMERGLVTPRRSGNRMRSKREYAEFDQQLNLPGDRDDSILRLLGKLEKRAPHAVPELRDWLLKDAGMDFAGHMNAVAARVAGKDLSGALALLKKTLRYHNVPAAWLTAARLHLMRGEPDAAFLHITELLKDVESPFRGDAYQCLVAYYRAKGDVETAGRLAEALQ